MVSGVSNLQLSPACGNSSFYLTILPGMKASLTTVARPEAKIILGPFQNVLWLVDTGQVKNLY